MSGANCGSGCTDCPSCRGGLHPESPVMQDTAFAMAMARGPQGTDTFLGPLSIAQTVLEGSRRRGMSGSGDHEVVDFLGVLTERMILSQGAPPSWTASPFATLSGTSPHGPIQIPDGILLDEGPKAGPLPVPPIVSPYAPGSGPATTPDDGYPFGKIPELLPLLPTIFTEEYLDSIGWPKCCPDPITFPEVFTATMEKKAGEMPWLGIRDTRPHWLIEIHYSGTVTWNPSPPPCLCSCCEFRQIIQKTVFTLSNCSPEVPAAPPDEVTPGQEDCGWWFAHVKDGTLRTNEHGDYADKWLQYGSCTKPPKPWWEPSVLVQGPIKYGSRLPVPTGVQPPPTPPPGWSPPVPYSDPGYAALECGYWMTDTPTVTVPIGCTFEWTFLVELQIYDRCRGRVKRRADFGWSIAGTANEDGIAWTKKLRKKKAKEK